MEAWANRDATADAPSTVVETWPGWGALAEEKGHAEHAPWTTYSQSTNDGNRWEQCTVVAAMRWTATVVPREGQP